LCLCGILKVLKFSHALCGKTKNDILEYTLPKGCWGNQAELFLPGGGTFSIGRWNFFSKAVELFQQGGGTFSAKRWNFFSKAVELFQQGGGTFLPVRRTFSPGKENFFSR
jgi:hypothetical protein